MEVNHITTNTHNDPIIQDLDRDTIRVLASLPHETQVFVKGVILGLYNQVAPTLPAAQQARPGV